MRPSILLTILMGVFVAAEAAAAGEAGVGPADNTAATAAAATPHADAADTAEAGTGIAGEKSAAERGQPYTWEQLVELVPGLRNDFELSHGPSPSDRSQRVWRVCRRFVPTGSHIPRTKCVPYQDFLAYVAYQRQRADQISRDILLGRSTIHYGTGMGAPTRGAVR